jgi:hypothetical protein
VSSAAQSLLAILKGDSQSPPSATSRRRSNSTGPSLSSSAPTSDRSRDLLQLLQGKTSNDLNNLNTRTAEISLSSSPAPATYSAADTMPRIRHATTPNSKQKHAKTFSEPTFKRVTQQDPLSSPTRSTDSSTADLTQSDAPTSGKSNISKPVAKQSKTPQRQLVEKMNNGKLFDTTSVQTATKKQKGKKQVSKDKAETVPSIKILHRQTSSTPSSTDPTESLDQNEPEGIQTPNPGAIVPATNSSTTGSLHQFSFNVTDIMKRFGGHANGTT